MKRQLKRYANNYEDERSRHNRADCLPPLQELRRIACGRAGDVSNFEQFEELYEIKLRQYSQRRVSRVYNIYTFKEVYDGADLMDSVKQ